MATVVRGGRIKEASVFTPVIVPPRSPLLVSRTVRPGKISTYYYKDFTKKASLRYTQFLAYLEAIAGDMFRYISPTIFTKSRVVASSERKIYACVSKKKPNKFVPASELTLEELQKLARDHKARLAQYIVGIYVFAEGDSHRRNWGVEKNELGDITGIIKIDHDNAFSDLIGLEFCSPPCLREAKLFPNSIFSLARSFDITTFDTESLPRVAFAKPVNWPTHEDLDQSVPEKESIVSGVLSTLEHDSRFIGLKYLMFCKLFLITENNIRVICDAHTITEEDSNKFFNYLKARLDKLRYALLSTASFRGFLLKYADRITRKLASHITTYNKQFERDGVLKIRYQGSDFLLSMEKVSEIQTIVDKIRNAPPALLVRLDYTKELSELVTEVLHLNKLKRLLAECKIRGEVEYAPVIAKIQRHLELRDRYCERIAEIDKILNPPADPVPVPGPDSELDEPLRKRLCIRD